MGYIARIYNYSFTPATKKIVFSDVGIVDVSLVQYIINVTRGVTLYDYSSPTLITTDGTNIVTISHSTAGMLYTDELDITYDFPLTSGGGTGTVTSVAASGGTTGLSWLGSPIISAGTLTLQGTLNATHGGTGLTTYSTGDIIYASAPNTLSKLAVGTNGRVLTLVGGIPTWQTPAAGGLTSLNALTGAVQTFTTGTAGTNFTIDSSGTVHTFNLPIASASNTGKLSSTDWATFNSKQPAGAYLTSIAGQDLSIADNSSSLFIIGADVPSNETDPVFTASDAANITATDITNLGNLSGTNSGDNAINTLYSGLVSNATHTGDATGATALTVVALNNTNLAGLATGLIKNTTGTGIPSIAVQADITPLLGAGSITNTMLANGAVANLSGVNTGDNATNTQYLSDYRAANFVAGTDYLLPSGDGSLLTGLTKTQVGLANVDNTSDVNKPVSTTQQTALNLKADIASPTFTGTVTLPAGQIVNGVTLATAGTATKYLSEDGTYTTPTGGLTFAQLYSITTLI